MTGDWHISLLLPSYSKGVKKVIGVKIHFSKGKIIRASNAESYEAEINHHLLGGFFNYF